MTTTTRTVTTHYVDHKGVEFETRLGPALETAIEEDLAGDVIISYIVYDMDCEHPANTTDLFSLEDFDFSGDQSPEEARKALEIHRDPLRHVVILNSDPTSQVLELGEYSNFSTHQLLVLHEDYAECATDEVAEAILSNIDAWARGDSYGVVREVFSFTDGVAESIDYDAVWGIVGMEHAHELMSTGI